MPRLLIVTTTPLTLRGFLLPYANHFRKEGWIVDAAAREASQIAECCETFDRVWDINWSRSPLDWNNFHVAPAQIRAAVIEGHYDIVHVHTPIAAFVTRIALRRMKKCGSPKIVYTAHGFHFHSHGSLLTNAIFSSLEKVAGHWTDYLVVINREDEAAARRLRIVPPERVRYMPGIGVDLRRYSSEAVCQSGVLAFRESLGLKFDQPLFTMIAEFNPGKRHEDAIRAFARLRHQNAHLAFAGVGPLEQAMRELCVELGIQDRVSFLGFRNDIPTVIRASVASLLPSRREGLPRSVMEVLSLGVPVIGADIRGIRDLLESGGGILFKLGDVDALGRAMQQVLDRPEHVTEMGHIAKQTITSYSLDKIIDHHQSLYEEVLCC